jgi:hypothetical protein
VVTEGGNVGHQHRHRATFTTSSANHRDELIDTLARFLITAGDLFKDDTLGISELLTHRGDEQDSPRRPTLTHKCVAQQPRVSKSPAQRNGGPHSP